MTVGKSVKQSLKAVLRTLGVLDGVLRTRDRARAKWHHLLYLWRNERLRRRSAEDGIPLPPLRLILIVTGSYEVPWFVQGGKLATECIREVLEKNGVSFGSLKTMLDFGCGCGRVVRHWRTAKGPEIHGSDYNPDLIRWCRRHLPFARFGLNGLNPPTEYPDGKFDFLYSLSVLTHLSEEVQGRWLGEWKRILRPGGYLLFTTHGEAYMHEMTPSEQEQFRAGRLVVKGAHAPGTNFCSSYHPQQYVRDRLAAGFEWLDFIPSGAKGNPHQDVYFLRKPALR